MSELGDDSEGRLGLAGHGTDRVCCASFASNSVLLFYFYFFFFQLTVPVPFRVSNDKLVRGLPRRCPPPHGPHHTVPPGPASPTQPPSIATGLRSQCFPPPLGFSLVLFSDGTGPPETLSLSLIVSIATISARHARTCGRTSPNPGQKDSETFRQKSSSF